ncbi:hypothetical protein BDP27DRAFT_1379142 [Rhodocollybia butyracea]|uniref:Thioesterase domain-containing protein n=1 Tax=Rhodocollybia butyracea TaxID=206335 RepID=A0A9P5QAC6_9AGAR|nr:hypothetical protein BDP27DRAFT_1379142 [Rhodocollybia butyracea]
MPSQDPASILGNASNDIKALLVDPRFSFNTLIEGSGQFYTTFAEGVVERIRISEVSLTHKVAERLNEEARVVCSIRVEEDMINSWGALHGGCSALLVDLCSTLSIAALQMHLTGKPIITVSQAINLVFHASAFLGEELKIINTSMTVGRRAVSAQTEIWSATNHRLVVSGVHVKMTPTRKPTMLTKL